MLFKLDAKQVSKRDLNKMLKEAGRLKKLQGDPNSGWIDFIRILDSYTDAMMDYKKNFNFSVASDEQIAVMKLHDRDIWLINNYIRKLPDLFVDNIEKLVAERKRIEDQQSAAGEENV